MPGSLDWTAIVLTAGSERQADALRDQIERRVEAGHLPGSCEYFVIADPVGRPLGSGGATLHALAELSRQLPAPTSVWWATSRVLLVNSGGDSRRLPAYGPCGKIFVPLPGPADDPLPPALFDRLVPAFLALPPGLPGAERRKLTLLTGRKPI